MTILKHTGVKKIAHSCTASNSEYSSRSFSIQIIISLVIKIIYKDLYNNDDFHPYLRLNYHVEEKP